jgi:hypothetical protein
MSIEEAKKAIDKIKRLRGDGKDIRNRDYQSLPLAPDPKTQEPDDVFIDGPSQTTP